MLLRGWLLSQLYAHTWWHGYIPDTDDSMQWFCFIILPLSLSLKNYEIHYRLSTQKLLNHYSLFMSHFPDFWHLFLPFLSFFLLFHYIPSHLLSTVFLVTPSPIFVHWSLFLALCSDVFSLSTHSLAAFPNPLHYPSSAVWEHCRPISQALLWPIVPAYTPFSQSFQHMYCACSPLPEITQRE